MPKTLTRSVDLEPIDRLEEKMKLLVGLIERLRGEQAQLDGRRTAGSARELDALRPACPTPKARAPSSPRCARSATSSATRVAEMLQQIEALNL